MHSISKLFILATIVTFASCIVTDDVTPDLYTFNVDVESMKAIRTCEGDGSDGEADLYTRITLYHSNANTNVSSAILAEQDYTLVQLDRWEEETQTGLAVTADVELVDGLIIEAILITYENDPSGSDAQETYGISVLYNEEMECWTPVPFGGDTSKCISGSAAGSSTFSKSYSTHLVEGTRCDIEINWVAELVRK